MVCLLGQRLLSPFLTVNLMVKVKVKVRVRVKGSTAFFRNRTTRHRTHPVPSVRLYTRMCVVSIAKLIIIVD